MSRLVRIGKITGCHGLQGHVKVRPAQDKPDWAAGKNRLCGVMAKQGEKALKLVIETAKLRDKLLLLRFEGYPDRTAAEALIGAELYADRDALPGPGKDEYWVDDLLGLSVIEQETGVKKGTVSDILSSGGQDFLEVALADSTETKIVPFVPHFFPGVDVANQTITVAGLAGFLEPEGRPGDQDKAP